MADEKKASYSRAEAYRKLAEAEPKLLYASLLLFQAGDNEKGDALVNMAKSLEAMRDDG